MAESQDSRSLRQRLDSLLIQIRSSTTPGDLARLRIEAESLSQYVKSARKGAPAGGRDIELISRKQYDEWIGELFEAVQQGTTRERLLDEWVKRFSEHHEIVNEGRHRGPWVVVLQTASAGRADEVEVLASHWAGFADPVRSTFEREQLASAAADPLIRKTLIEQSMPPLPLIYAGFQSSEDYGGWFDALLMGVDRERARNRHYWIVPQPLASERRVGAGAIYLLYPALESTVEPRYPNSATADQRLLSFFSMAYRHNDFQIRSLAELAERHRTNMIRLLAPGLINHEIGGVSRSVSRSTHTLAAELVKLNEAWDIPELDLVARAAVSTANQANFLGDITHAFNRLETRGRGLQNIKLEEVFTQVRLLLNNRLGSGASLKFDESLSQVQISVDSALLTLALLNVITNALNAFDEFAPPTPTDPKDEWKPIILVQRGSASPDVLAIDICNNGPQIPASVAPHVFKRGFSTRSEGHGQGLFFVSLVCNYLGGEARLLEADVRPKGCNVAFRLTLSFKPQNTRELAMER